MRKKIAILTVYFFVFQLAIGDCQKLAFENFNVDRGLSQSQVLSIVQDKSNYLWIGTLSGLNRFDGVQFKTFSKKDGLMSNEVSCLFSSSNGDIWIGDKYGLTRYNGFRFQHFGSRKEKETFYFHTITEGADGVIYALDNMSGLYIVQNNELRHLSFEHYGKSPTCLYRATDGALWLYLKNDGFYKWQKHKWQKIHSISVLDEDDFVNAMAEHQGVLFAISAKGSVMKIKNENIVQIKKIPAHYLVTLNVDIKNNLWIGCSRDLILLNGDDLSIKEIINSKNGLSDNIIHTIYKDSDNNIWLGSDGDGLYKYCNGPFVKFDKSNGLTGNLVMGFAYDNAGKLLMGTREGKLLKYNDNGRLSQATDYSKYSSYGANCLGNDLEGNTYIGTMDARLLKIEGNNISEISLGKKYRPSIYAIKNYGHRMLVHTSEGAYWIDGTSVQKIAEIQNAVLGSIRLNNNEILIGGADGLFVYANNGNVRQLKIPLLKGINISCFEIYANYVVIGSLGEGLFFWKYGTNIVTSYNTDNGLTNNNVFAVMKDARGILWVGTSSGIQQFQLGKDRKEFEIKDFSIADGYESSETNLNAIVEDRKHNVWIGTTKGAFMYNPMLDKSTIVGKPVMVLESVEISNLKDSSSLAFSPGNHLPINPEIAYANNSIAFTFRGIYLRDPAALRYSYQLYGYDATFSLPKKETSLNYKNLPFGEYVFKVKAYTPDGKAVSDILEYPFSVNRPYYKTIWFALIIAFGLILCGILIQISYAKQKRLRIKQINQIKMQELQKIREQTAEDFHDDMGNKLTRISLLADVLQTKTNKEDEEKKNIIDQIKSNALGLYTGTKEIIWSLSQESDNLNEMLCIIRQTGIELFSNTDVEFEFTGIENIDDDTKIPLEYNRNVIMIFKELMSNSMRHAKATKVLIECRKEAAGTVGVYFTDDGIGFNKDAAKGNGLNNIKRRAEKIGGTFIINSIKHLGTTCCLIFNIQDGWSKK